MNIIKRHWLSLILFAALLVRLPQMFAPLWNDEAFVWVISGRSLLDWWTALSGDVHPPLWYAAEYAVAQVSRTPAALRIIPLLCGLLVVWLAPRVARALGAAEPEQIAVALIAAFTPAQIYYSAEIRMYSLLAALYLFGAWAVLARRWWLMALAMALMLYTHHYGFVYALVLGLLALAQNWNNRGRIMDCGGAALIAYFPLLPTTAAQVVGTGSYWAGLSFQEFVIALAGWLSGWALERMALTAVLIVCSLALLGAATWRAIYRREYPLLWLTFGPVLIALVLCTGKNVWISRALIGSAVMACVLLGMQITSNRWAALALLAPVLAVGTLADQTRTMIAARYGTGQVVAIIREQLRPDDSILCLGSVLWMELQPYQLPIPIYISETGDHLEDGGLTATTRAALGMTDAPGGHGRRWIFAARLLGYEPVIPAGARLVYQWTSAEQSYKSELYIQEAE